MKKQSEWTAVPTFSDMYPKEFYNSDLDIVECGHETCVPEKETLHLEGREHYVLHYVEDGKGTFVYHGQKIRLQAGDIFILIPRMAIEYYPDPEDPWTYYWVGFQGLNAKYLLKECGVTEDMPVLHYPKNADLVKFLGEIVREYGEYDRLDLQCLGYLYIVLSRLIALKRQERSEETNVARMHVNEAIRFIGFNYMHNITVNDVANDIRITPNYLSSLFQEVLGMSTKEFLIKSRIQSAAQYLSNSELSVTQISEKVGYPNSMYFSKEFKRLMKVTPTKYRELQKTNQKEQNVKKQKQGG